MAPRSTMQQHLKITEYLRAQIERGDLKPGDLLPSEAEMCEQFNTSRGPVRQAIAALRSEGVISSGRGRRSVVLSSSKAETFDDIISITHWARNIGIDPDQETLWMARRPAPANAARALRIQEGDPVIFVHRKRSGNGNLFALERMYFPLEVGQKILNFDPDSGSIHRELQKQGVEFDNVRRRMRIAFVEGDDARLLEVEDGTPVFNVELEAYDHSGNPQEFAQVTYLTEYLEFAMTNVRGGFSPLEVIVRCSDEDTGASAQ